MLFSSFSFLFAFFPLFMAVYVLTPKKWRYVALVVFSLLFYAFGDVKGLLLLVCSALLHYGLALLPRKRTAVALAAALDLGLLFYFKYIVGVQPLGLSFYSFTALAYVIDVCRGEPAEKNPVRALAYMAAFPKVLSGPITRYGETRDSLRAPALGFGAAQRGILRFLSGLCKKTLLAAPASEMWQYLSAQDGDARGVLGSWLALLFYAFWLYFDFSGYTDLALGLGKIMGISLPENFRYPYTAQSPKDFWRRWHISLSSWFRDYVYIPLGGSRCAPWRNTLNLLAVWVLTGLWHGNSPSFLIWGLYWFLLLWLSRLFEGKTAWIPRAVKRAAMIPVILVGWLIFAFEDMAVGAEFAKSLIFGNSVGKITLYELSRSVLLLAVLALGCGPLPKRFYDKHIRGRAWKELPVAIGGFALSAVYLIGGTQQSFLYFKF